MLRLLVPPVGPGSSPQEVARWIRDLQQMHQEYQELPQVVATVEWRLSEAWAWVSERREVA